MRVRLLWVLIAANVVATVWSTIQLVGGTGGKGAALVLAVNVVAAVVLLLAVRRRRRAF